MKRDFLSILRCQDCRNSEWDLNVDFETEGEVREGRLSCRFCQKAYRIHGGILDVLGKELPAEVAQEKSYAESFGYLATADGHTHVINHETIHQFRNLFLSLPAGDGSHFFKPGGSFENQGGNAERFFKTLQFLDLKGGERVLEVGSSFGWGAWRFAQRGCKVTALDVTNYLMAADLYMNEDDVYFERVMADMSKLPFRDVCFDIVFSHSVIHHCKDLGSLFAEFWRVLKPGGRAVALHECSLGILEDKSGRALQEAVKEGFNENAYTIPEWKKAAREGGFRKIKLHFFPFTDDYIYRKKLRGSAPTSKLTAAEWIKAHPPLNQFLNTLSFWPRILWRPKAWMMLATK